MEKPGMPLERDRVEFEGTIREVLVESVPLSSDKAICWVLASDDKGDLLTWEVGTKSGEWLTTSYMDHSQRNHFHSSSTISKEGPLYLRQGKWKGKRQTRITKGIEEIYFLLSASSKRFAQVTLGVPLLEEFPPGQWVLTKPQVLSPYLSTLYHQLFYTSCFYASPRVQHQGQLK